MCAFTPHPRACGLMKRTETILDLRPALKPFLTLAMAAAFGLVAACSSGGRSASSSDRDAALPPQLTAVTAESGDLLFRFKGESGAFQSATSIDEIPKGCRANVQVIDLSLSPEARSASRYVQVFDLRQARPDGRFPGRIVSRDTLEAELAETVARPPQAEVTMYSTAWCGVCRKARSFLRKEGIVFVEKDIEKSPEAGKELQRKAAAAGVEVGGVPVFDVGGRILSGFDGPTILRLARQVAP